MDQGKLGNAMGIQIGSQYYVNGVFGLTYRGRKVKEPETWTHVVGRPTCYIGRKILEEFGLPKTFSIRHNSLQTREDCVALARAWVDRMHFLSQHLCLARLIESPRWRNHL